MPIYIIPWSMVGEVEVHANSKEEAMDRFEQMSVGEIADTNSGFSSDPPMTEEEIDAQNEEWSRAGLTPLDNILREELIQSMEKKDDR